MSTTTIKANASILGTFTQNDKIFLRIQLEAELCQRSLYEFFTRSTKILEPSTQWIYNWHFEYVCNILQQEFERIQRGDSKTTDIILSLPFRCGKSLMVSTIFPAWALIKDPSIPIINISATQDLATKFSHKAKMLIDSTWYQERFGGRFQLRQDSKAKSNFITDKGGSITAFGIGSTIIGSGGAMILIDDPNSPTDISQVSMTNVINTYLDVVYSRLNNPDVGLRLIMQQRVNVNDLTGYLLRTQPEKYLHICIPAILSPDLEPPELSERYIDGLFWSNRFSRKVLDDFSTTLRPQAFASQLMMRPSVIEGDLIKREWFKTIKLSEIQKVNPQWNIVIDTAYTNSTKNDPSAIMICGMHGNILYIRKVYQRWLQFFELLEFIKEQQLIYNIKKIFVESKATGLSVQQELKRQTNFVVLPLTPIGDKTTRVMSIQPQLQSGRVILVEDDSNEIFLNECAAFPNGRDDIVDTLCYSVTEFLKKGSGTVFRSV
jgi:predicted phage terminase large subunit-like protein